jgi:hypothetical protein
MEELSIVGRQFPQFNAREKVTGKAKTKTEAINFIKII